MSPNKKKKAQAKPVNETPLAPKGAYEGNGLYDRGTDHQSLRDEIRAHHHNARRERDSRLYEAAKSRHQRQDVEDRQVIPLLFVFKWIVLGVIGLGLVVVLKIFLGGFNKDAAKEIADLRAQVSELQRTNIERPLLDLTDVDQIPVFVQRWEAARDDLQAAQDLMRWDRRDEAVRRLHDALGLAPDYQSVRVLTAQIAMMNGEYERAANMLVHTVNVDPSRYDLILLLAQALEKLSKDKAALSVAEWALTIHATDLDALGVASRSSVRLEDWASAIKHFDKILIVDENNLDALKGASVIYFRDKNYAKALPLFVRLMSLEPEEWHHFFSAAVCQAQLDQPENTVTTLELAAANFGDASVFGWIGSSQFDPVREDNLFRGFRQRVTAVAQSKVQKKIEEEKPVFAPEASSLPSGEALKASDLK